MGLMCTQPGGGCFDPTEGFGIYVSGGVRSRGFMCWMILDIVRHRNYHDSVPRLGRLLDLVVVVHMFDRCVICVTVYDPRRMVRVV